MTCIVILHVLPQLRILSRIMYKPQIVLRNIWTAPKTQGMKGLFSGWGRPQTQRRRRRRGGRRRARAFSSSSSSSIRLGSTPKHKGERARAFSSPRKVIKRSLSFPPPLTFSWVVDQNVGGGRTGIREIWSRAEEKIFPFVRPRIKERGLITCKFIWLDQQR